MADEIYFVNKFIFFQERNKNDYFYNSLIYIFEHDKNGALGIVVNKVIPIKETKIFETLDLPSNEENKHLLNGGPVDINKLFVIHDQKNIESSLTVKDGLNLTTDIDVIKSIGNGFFKGNYKLALGYCGWGSGQLDYEVSRNSWLILNINPGVIFDNKAKELITIISKQVGYDIDKIQNSEIITKH
tara:strand:- start:120 stop:677 length:558 start_codon:yes stop_codon:yes gene_type:complete